MTEGMPSGSPEEPVSPPPESPESAPVVPDVAPVPVHDIGARALWTLAEAAVAALIAWVVGLGPEDNPEWFAVVTSVGAAVLSVIKSFIATKVGNPDTATFS